MRRSLSKKAVSPVIGYILLISFVIVISLITFQWVKTYIPKEALQCPDGVSMFIQDFTYDCNPPGGGAGDTLNLTLKNNGRFNVYGYFIRASQYPDQLATHDLSYFNPSKDNGKVSFSTLGSTENSFVPGESEQENFTITNLDLLNLPFSYIEIIPIRYQEVDNKLRLSSCGNAKIQEVLCSGVVACVPIPGDPCAGFNCGTTTNGCVDVVCGDFSGACQDGWFCSDPNGGTCADTCGNGVWDEGEECDYAGICTGDSLTSCKTDGDCSVVGGTCQGQGLFCNDDTQASPCTCQTGYITDTATPISCMGVPDLTIEGLTLQSGVKSGNDYVVTIAFNVKNIGTASASEVNWTTDFGETGVLVDSATLPTLDVNTPIPDTPSWTYDVAGQYILNVTVDYYQAISEYNETNNSAVITIDCVGNSCSIIP